MRRNHDGFTIVELIVSITIMGIIAVMAVPSFSAFINASRLSFSTQLVETTLGKAFSQARAKPVAMVVRGWKYSRRMEFVRADEPPSVGECQTSEATCQQMDSGVYFSDDFEIEFLPPYGDIDGENSNTEITISGPSESVKIMVHHSSGLVETFSPEKK